MNSTSIRFHENGGPEVLRWEKNPVSDPDDQEITILHHAIGVNFVDTYFRSGLYKTTLPSGVGTEASGVVEKVGREVKHLKVGDRVAYCQGPHGAYAERRNIPARFVVKIPDNVSFETAAAVMLKGLTVHYLLREIHPVKKDEMFLFHAAAGGVGLIACQWAKHLGAKLIGTASSDEKCTKAKTHGAFETINYSEDDVAKRVSEMTNGSKVSVVFDGVGKSTWEASLNCLKPKGLMVSFGNASGPVTGVNLGILAEKGSLYVTRPILGHYIDSLEKLLSASHELFTLVSSGIIKAEDTTALPLSKAKEAHELLQDRNRVSGLILLP